MTINITPAELLVICNALDKEAKSLDRFERELNGGELVDKFKEKAALHRDLASRLREDSEIGEAKSGFDQAIESALAARNRNLATRIRAERRMARALVNTILERGYLISINDGEDWVVRRSADKAAIMLALFSTDEDEIHLRGQAGDKAGWFKLIYGNSGWDVVSDYSDNEVCNRIWDGVVEPLATRIEGELS